MSAKIVSFLLVFLIVGATAVARQAPRSSEVYFSDSLVQHDKDFGYMKNIDSLLRAFNHEADSLNRVMTFNTGKKESGISRFIAALFSSRTVQIIFWSLLGIFILFIIYRLFEFHVPVSKKSGAGAESAEIEELRNTSWYREEISRAETSGDFTLAVRYRFLKLLAEMNDKGIIQFFPEKTNEAYVSEIKQSGLKDSFIGLKNIYEYIWYGKRKIDSAAYSEVSAYFDRSENLI